MSTISLKVLNSPVFLEHWRLRRPENRDELAQWVTWFTGLHMPKHATCAEHQTPLDYLAHTFFETAASGDALVWACRGGGKTMLGAVATLLDLLFKPGIQIRILAGSFEQSEKMYTYLRALCDANFSDQLQQHPTRRRLVLRNGSAVEVLAQSESAVRGQRVQRIRCDEVELFKPELWQAVQLTTRSLIMPDGKIVAGPAIEALSTMHKHDGTMQRLLAEKSARRPQFAWCIWDVIATCHANRVCATCPLWNDCGGRAKHANGFVSVDDVIAMHSRTARSTWEHEMLCLPPRLENAVFPAFRVESHVRPFPLTRIPERNESMMIEGRSLRFETLICGVDFGYAQAFVCLWVALFRDAAGSRVAWVADELVVRHQVLEQNIAAMRRRAPVALVPGEMPEPWRPAVVYCDVAGRGNNGQTGRTDETLLREGGFKVHSAGMEIEYGVALLNQLVDPATALLGGVRLLMDPRCERLIAAMQGYHRKQNGEILKDGTHDHLIDALRYAIVNHDQPKVGKLEIRMY